MKRFWSFIYGMISFLFAFAQKGHVRPEDLMTPDELENISNTSSSTSGDNPVLWVILVVVIVIGVIWFNLALKSNDQKDIQQGRRFHTINEILGFTTENKLVQNGHNFSRLESYYKESNGIVMIPNSAKCVILEYMKGNNTCVKVKFDDYPEPLYVKRWLLKLDEQ